MCSHAGHDEEDEDKQCGEFTFPMVANMDPQPDGTYDM
jgi:hypothetical protein